ncbi:MAG: family 20 glycosylhydrolase [Phycisphaeraceae bacterium]|nr:MAG: family 20 glycosylhydrolase [Phycisphaeraceae bacterium]
MSRMSDPGDAMLSPAPRRVELLGGSVPGPGGTLGWRAPMGFDVTAYLSGVARGQRRGVDQPAWLECRLDPNRPRDPRTARGQSYLLKIGPARAGEPVCVITGGTTAGLGHGVSTLVQVLSRYGAEVPSLAISDEPAYPVRGVMLDVSRCRVPTMEELRRVVDAVSGLKGNHLQLYTEHTFAYADHAEVWRGADPLTAGEVRELDAYAASRGVELAANQNCFGHLARWLRLPKYAPLAETHGEWVFDVWPRRGPFSLCPTDPASVSFVRGLLEELVPNVKGPLVNIGCDETFDVGWGRSKGEVARVGRGRVYAGFVSAVAGVVRSLGKRAMFWGDIALSDPSCLRELPPDLIGLAWGYEPSSDFERWCEALGGAGLARWVCPGTSSWRSITGRTSERRGNIGRAARAGLAGGAAGFLICDWGDTGHHQPWPIAWHGIAEGLATAWNPDADPDPGASWFQTVGPAGEALGPWLDALGDADAELRRTSLALSRAVPPGAAPVLLNQSALFIDLFKTLDEQREVGRAEDWARARERVAGLASSIPAGLDDLTRRELGHTLAYAAFAAERGHARRVGGVTSAWRCVMAGRARALGEEHASLWRARSREGGLAESLAYFDGYAGGFGS